jgi:hypothetical protein
VRSLHVSQGNQAFSHPKNRLVEISICECLQRDDTRTLSSGTPWRAFHELRSLFEMSVTIHNNTFRMMKDHEVSTLCWMRVYALLKCRNQWSRFDKPLNERRMRARISVRYLVISRLQFESVQIVSASEQLMMAEKLIQRRQSDSGKSSSVVLSN